MDCRLGTASSPDGAAATSGTALSAHDAAFALRAMRAPCYLARMTVEDIEKAVAKLAPDELAKFRAWFEAFEAERFDRKIARDANSGKLDRLADEALGDFRAGRAREL